MITHGVGLAEAHEPPRVPHPFLYRPFGTGGAHNETARQPREVALAMSRC